MGDKLTAPGLAELAQEASADIAAAIAPTTRRAYASAWARFVAFCELHDQQALPAPATTLILYLAFRARSVRPSTLELDLSAIGRAHELAGHANPRRSPHVRAWRKGHRRRTGVAPQQVLPLLAAELAHVARLLEARSETAKPRARAVALRDRAMLLIGWCAMLRRSELAALHVGDITETADGLSVLIRRSKADQEGEGVVIGVPRGLGAACPVLAWRAYLEAAPAEADAPAFRRAVSTGPPAAGAGLSPKTVGRRVKAAAELGGADPAGFGGHSLRAGCATSAAAAGKAERAIMRQGRWRSRAMVDRYVRAGGIFGVDNPTLGLLG